LKLPFFSIIVPTYARPVQLSSCLRSLADLNYPYDRFEVIVVDDGSGRSMEPVVAPFQNRPFVKLLTQANAGPAAARNRGAAHANGDLLAFTDDDCAPDRNWLQALAARFEKGPGHAVGGKTINTLPDNLFSTVSQIIIDAAYAHYNAMPDRARFFASNNLAMPSRLFSELGGFDPTFRTSEDRDLCDRWVHHGYPMVYAPEALVRHTHPLALRTFLSQHFHYGRGAFRFYRARARRGSGRFAPEVRLYAEVLRHSFLPRQDRRTLFILGLLAFWQGANLTGFVREWIGQAKE
jgi:GT2 family glycosyltransferase